MVRFLALSLTVLLTVQATPAFAQSITVNGKLSGGNSVSAVCSVGATGQITGNGVLSGTNPRNGYTYKYPFTITEEPFEYQRKGAITSGKVVLTGTLVGAGYPVTLSATVPSGAMTFSYIVKGQVITMSGTGTVTVK